MFYREASSAIVNLSYGIKQMENIRRPCAQYYPSSIFNIHEIKLFWKRTLERSLTTKLRSRNKKHKIELLLL
jgi:hypothetical protein